MSREQMSGCGVPLVRNNVDTDQIIPARFCLRPQRTGHADSLFGDWRLDPSFVLHNPIYAGATILVAGREFATGSSREYAVWAIKDYGFQVVIAQSFGDIFYKNAILNDLLPLKTTEQGIETLWGILERNPKARIEIDLANDTIKIEDRRLPAMMDLHYKRKYILNLDDIAQTLEEMESIQAYEASRPKHLATTSHRGEVLQ